MFLKEFREKTGLTQKEVANILELQAPALARYEALNVAPTSSFLKKYCETLDANPNFIFFGKEPYLLSVVPEIDQESCNIINDLLSLFSLEDFKKKLKILMINEVLERVEKFDHWIINVLNSLFFVGDSLRCRPFLFLYYIFQLIVIDKSNKKSILDYKHYIINQIEEFKVLDLKTNKPLFTNKIKTEFIGFFEVKVSEDECRLLVQQASAVLKSLEEKMPTNVIRANRAIFHA